MTLHGRIRRTSQLQLQSTSFSLLFFFSLRPPEIFPSPLILLGSITSSHSLSPLSSSLHPPPRSPWLPLAIQSIHRLSIASNPQFDPGVNTLGQPLDTLSQSGILGS